MAYSPGLPWNEVRRSGVSIGLKHVALDVHALQSLDQRLAVPSRPLKFQQPIRGDQHQCRGLLRRMRADVSDELIASPLLQDNRWC